MQDLRKIDHAAYLSEKRGQQGVFYSEADIRFVWISYASHVIIIFFSALAQNRKDMALVKDDMIPEVAIKRCVRLRI